MLRHYIYAVTAMVIAAGVGLTGCVADDAGFESENPSEAASGLTLELQICRSGVSTRAGDTGEEFTVAEKHVNSVDLFFFKADATGAITNQTAVQAFTVVPKMGEDPTKTNTGKMVVSVDPELVFEGYDPDATSGTHKCVVYAVVNADARGRVGDTPTLSALKALTVTSESFVKDPWKDETKTTDGAKKFEGFVMFSSNPDGDVVSLDMADPDKKIKGSVHVSKPASKIELFLGFGSKGGSVGSENGWFTVHSKNPNDPTEDAQDWRVYFDETRATEAFIVNGVKTVRLGAYEGARESDWYFDLWEYDTADTPSGDEAAGDGGAASDNLSNYAHSFAASGADDKATYPYVTNAPFYTYPNSWTTDVLEQHRTYLILKVNWIPVASTDIQSDLVETYYMIPFNVGEDAKNNKVAPNTHYRIKVKINTLGGRHFGEPVILDDCSYEILPWGNNALDATLRETRYLELGQTVQDPESGEYYHAIMTNSETTTVSFKTSHKVAIAAASVTYFDYYETITDQDTGVTTPVDRTDDITGSNTDAFTLTYDLLTGDNDYAGVYIDEIGSKLTVKHKYFPIEKKSGATRYTHKTTRNFKGKIYDGNMYSPYVITITLTHKDLDNSFDKTIRIIQYPSMYVTMSSNRNEERYNFGGNVITNHRRTGYARVNGGFDNGYGGIDGMDDKWWTSFWRGTLSYTTNPIMYVIKVTAFSEEEAPMHVGDPRMLHVKNNLGNESDRYQITNDGKNVWMYEDLQSPDNDNEVSTTTNWQTTSHHNQAGMSNTAQCTSAPVWNDGANTGESNRRLKYYYPTEETPLPEYKYMVSPKFRVSSSFGSRKPNTTLTGLGNRISRTDARKRCASYQEDGYPAGRWRLPTLGEYSYIAKLSRIGIIPQLFVPQETYWTSHGLYGIDANTLEPTEDISRENAFQGEIFGEVRCVYDDWYWVKADGSEDKLDDNLRATFYWGDRLRNNPQQQPNTTTVQP